MGAYKYEYIGREEFAMALEDLGYPKSTVSTYITAVLTPSREGYSTVCKLWEEVMDIPLPTEYIHASRVFPVQQVDCQEETDTNPSDQVDVAMPTPQPLDSEDVGVQSTTHVVTAPEILGYVLDCYAFNPEGLQELLGVLSDFRKITGCNQAAEEAFVRYVVVNR